MHKFNRLAFINIRQFCGDCLFLILSFLGAYLFASVLSNLYPIVDYLWVLVIFIPIWLFSMAQLGMYNSTTFNYVDRIFRNVVLSTFFAGISVIILFYYTKDSFFSRRLYSLFLITTIVFLMAERYLLLCIIRNHRNSADKKVLIIGNEELIEKFEYYLMKTQIAVNIVGYMGIASELPSKFNCVGDIRLLYDYLRDNIVDEVIFALPGKLIEEAREYVAYCEEMGLTVRIVIDLYGLKLAKTYVSSVGTLPMLTFHTTSLNNVQLVLKRTIDILGAVIGLAITGMVSLAVIPAIKLDSPGPVFFKQDRVGLNGRLFKLYKFRSMYIDAEAQKQELMSQNQMEGGLMFKIKQDPRVTRVGDILRKTSLDELPQFWNVLKGDMSLVGTRPPTLDEVSRYQNGHRRRISIKPGLTGLWQVSGRSSITDFDEVVRLDTFYIDHWSIYDDFKIILKTIPAILNKKGAM